MTQAGVRVKSTISQPGSERFTLSAGGLARLQQIAQALGVPLALFLSPTSAARFDEDTLERFLALPEAADFMKAMVDARDGKARRRILESAATTSPAQEPRAGKGRLGGTRATLSR